MPSNPPSSDDAYECFLKLFAHYENDLRTFIRSLLPTWHDADEVLQQSALVIWRKFDQFDASVEGSAFMKWACVIARFEALAYRRKMARDRLVFREDILDLMAEEGTEEIDSRQAEYDALESCLAALSEKQRKLVTLAYTPGVKVKELAEQAGSTSAAFYMRLNRLRKDLMQCIENKVQATPMT